MDSADHRLWIRRGVISAVATVLLVACGGDAQLGAPLEGEAVQLRQIASSPEEFLDRPVVVSGTVTEVCPTRGCWFFVGNPQASLRVEIEPEEGFLLSPRWRDRQVRVLLEARRRGDDVVLLARGIERSD